jgi:hypothetical protein
MLNGIHPTTRTVVIRMAIIMVSVVALDAVVVFFSPKPLFWAASIPGLIPILTPFAIWPVIRASEKTER